MARTGQMPYFHFYPQDWWGSDAVSAMSPAARGAYIELLCRAWMQDQRGVLPDEDERLRRWAKVDREQWLEIRHEVMLAFHKTSREGRQVLVQRRLEQESMKMEELAKKRARGAHATNEKRWGSVAQRRGSESHSESLTSRKSEVRSQKSEVLESKETYLSDSVKKPKAVPSGDRESDEFVIFYEKIWPRREGRRTACAAWNAAVTRHSKRLGKPSGEIVSSMLQRARQWADAMRGREVSLIKLPATWLNSDTFRDEPPEERT